MSGSESGGDGPASTVLHRLKRAIRGGSSVGGIDRKRVLGDAILIDDDPVLERFTDAVFVPQTSLVLTDDPHWGVFDSSGDPIAAAFYRRGPGPVRQGGADAPPSRLDTLPRLDDAPYVYLGHFSAHYGHFLLTSLARLWPLVRDALPAGRKLIYHAPEPPDLWFSLPFVAQILGAFGLTRDDFAFFAEPVRLDTLFVPGPSFEESHRAHRVHRQLGSAIGEALLATPIDAERDRAGQPLYLSRTRLAGGTHRITNEDVLVEALAGRGFAIAFPEELSLTEQVRLFDRHATMVCLVGSALHTSLLSRRPNGIVGISMQPALRSDYPLIDRLADNKARYLFQPFYEEAADTAGFHRSARFAHPKRVIDSVLRAVDALG